VLSAIFITGMLVGFVLMMGSLIVRRRGSAVAARLMLSCPPAGLCAAALFVLSLDVFSLELKAALIVLLLATGIPLLAAVLLVKITSVPIAGQRS
jgi:hypothetical protein